MQHYKISGVTILFHPEISVINNIASYIDELDILYVIDNSPAVPLSIGNYCASHTKIIYIKNLTNVGVAEALNMGARLAIENSSDFLLTMDQDSYFPENEFTKFLNVLYNIKKDKVGILSPLHQSDNKVINRPGIRELQFVMTSGNLVNLEIYQKAGPFLNELFIDHIDHEYGLRLNSKGFKVLQSENITLKHNLGSKSVFKIFGLIRFRYISHSPLRHYYMIRNGFYLASLYKKADPSFYYLNLKLVFKELAKIIFLEDTKGLRLKFGLRGYRDFKSRKFGAWKD